MFIEYNRQDVIAEHTIAKKLAKWPVPDEIQTQWAQNLLMNTRGVSIDTTLVDGALYIADCVTEPLLAEAAEISGIANPNSTAQLKAWLKREGLEIDTLRKEDIGELLERNDFKPHVRRMLEIKKELSKSSLAKYEAMLKVKCSDGKAHGLTAFYGASRTGRFAGRLIQLQNLPRTYLSGKALDTARLIVKSKDMYLLHALYGSESDTLSQLIRTALIPSTGHKFIDADFSSIEARVLAWLAGEQWSLEVFRTHGKIYEAQASQMFGVPISIIKRVIPNMR